MSEASVVAEGHLAWGLQLPVQSQSTRYVEPWEPGSGPEVIAAVAEAADRSGAFYVAVCDHVAIPDELAETMGVEWWDTVATLSWLAGRTERVHLLSHVYVPAYRHPLVVAKAWATLDRISGGRAILGVGAGHVEGEFDALGVSFRDRGRILDESIMAVRAAFTPGSGSGVTVAPTPARPGGPPIWIGGSSPAAMRRVVARGDGWLPQGPPGGGMRAAVARLREEAEAARPGTKLDLGGMAAPVHVGDPAEVRSSGWDVGEHTVVGSPDEVAASVARLASTGVDHIQVRFRTRSAAELVEQVERFGQEVWPLVNEAAGTTPAVPGTPGGPATSTATEGDR